MKSLLLVLTIVTLSLPSSALADTEVNPNRRNSSVVLEAEKEVRPSNRSAESTAPAKSHGKARYSRIYSGCRVDAETGLYGCRNVDPDDPEPEGQELTEGDVLRAVRELGLPSLKVQIQPGDETLVNVETIFWTRPQAFERSITLLGFDIDVVADPVRYTWIHDDGTRSTTSRPGRPYPAMDVTHRYRKPADDVHPRVDVTYRVRYRVDGGSWQTIGQTLQASGPAAELDVREAAPVLTKP
jgi:hypothetical protein